MTRKGLPPNIDRGYYLTGTPSDPRWQHYHRMVVEWQQGDPMTRLQDTLPPDACTDARTWLGDRTDAAEAWRECPRGDWMLWLLACRHADRRRLVLAACECARLALAHVPEGEDRPRLAIEAAEGWARGEAGLAGVRSAADAADDAYAAAAAYAAAYAYADADADARAATLAAADAAATYAVYAADAAAYAAAADAAAAASAAAEARATALAACPYDADARAATLAACADIVRRHFPDPPEETP